MIIFVPPGIVQWNGSDASLIVGEEANAYLGSFWASSVSLSQAGEEGPVKVAASLTMVASMAVGGPSVEGVDRLASHRWVRSAKAGRRGSFGCQSNAASYSR
jgi:hypothetical protein